ncbi:bacteriophage protein [Xenorhabdus mauleonii]|uniref:Bacteriophage protein n=1 Tax=Xenorhabdus mauleonii TaxID=351675 RepID=A0A1I3WMW6_9GAMM|nr:hypothetical protein [Xenorhabdus mauleonii]PHM39277.1 bacteriophage protein [Xenorhabdus mauleonii]SFK09044.1 hypothetical protein SAMN05421680_12832 [Xenorhabdus mauleonii]
MTVYLKRMPLGIAGAISRLQDMTVEPVVLKSANLFPAYGLVGKYEGDYFVPLAEGDTADKIQGIYVRPYPTTSMPDKAYIIGINNNYTGDNLKRGYMTVKLDGDASSIKKGAPVYVRTGKATKESPLGSFLNTEIPGETVLLPLAQFTGAGDADGNVEISYKI